MKNMDREYMKYTLNNFYGPYYNHAKNSFFSVESRVFPSPCANCLCGKLTDLIREQTNTLRDEINRYKVSGQMGTRTNPGRPARHSFGDDALFI